MYSTIYSTVPNVPYKIQYSVQFIVKYSVDQKGARGREESFFQGLGKISQ